MRLNIEFIRAIESTNVIEFKKLLSNSESDINSSDSDGNTLLHLAAMSYSLSPPQINISSINTIHTDASGNPLFIEHHDHNVTREIITLLLENRKLHRTIIFILCKTTA